MKALAYAVLRAYCSKCNRLIWPWQSRCGSEHRTCAHRAILESWHRNLDATGGPTSPWRCSWCGEVLA